MFTNGPLRCMNVNVHTWYKSAMIEQRERVNVCLGARASGEMMIWGGDKMLLDDDSDIMCKKDFYTREQRALR